MTPSKKVKLITTLTLAVLSLVIILQNTESVTTRILFFTVSMPRSLLLLSVCLVGFVAGCIVTLALKKSDK